jgi:multicomponent Na+:H+ antiporter subunit A
MAALISAGFILAFAAPFIFNYSRRIASILFPLYPLICFIFFLFHANNEVLQQSFPWLPFLNINLSFYLDGLSLLFALIISGIGFPVMIYAGEYMKNDEKAGKFYLFLIFFMASMLGLVLSGNLISLFIFWEFTSISSFFLIGHKNKDEKARKSAIQALQITAGGGLVLLAGIVMLGSVFESYEYADILQNPDLLQTHFHYSAIMLMFCLGAFTKSAQFPFHFWLPNAMSAPTPVSAYLHSATMVKAGIYLLLRMSPVFSGNIQWTELLMFIGSATMLTGAVLSVFEVDLKKILAYTTISSLGTLVFLIGIGEHYAIVACIVFLVVHSLYKGAFFLTAGSIDYLTGTRDITKLKGLFKAMPILGAAGIAAALSSSGIPPFLGFLGKELVYESAITFGRDSYLFISVAMVSNILLVIAGLNVGIKPFVGKQANGGIKENIKVPFALWFGPVLLGVCSLVAGIFPGLLSVPLIKPAAQAVLLFTPKITLVLWHGFTPVLLLSILTVSLGLIFYYFKLFTFSKHKLYPAITARGPESWYNLLFKSILKFGVYQTRVLQNGYLRVYLMIIILTLTVFSFTSMRINLNGISELLFKEILIHELFIILTVVVASVLIIFTRSRLTAVASLGLIGYGLAIIFVLFGAPDIAMTQFTIDTLTVILFVLILWKLPHFSLMSPPSSRIRDLFISVIFGGMISFLLLLIISNPQEGDLKRYYSESSYLLGHGRNIVNVILVDFRSLDTLGEITVLAVAAIGVYSLLKFKKGVKL